MQPGCQRTNPDANPCKLLNQLDLRSPQSWKGADRLPWEIQGPAGTEVICLAREFPTAAVARTSYHGGREPGRDLDAAAPFLLSRFTTERTDCSGSRRRCATNPSRITASSGTCTPPPWSAWTG